MYTDGTTGSYINLCMILSPRSLQEHKNRLCMGCKHLARLDPECGCCDASHTLNCYQRQWKVELVTGVSTYVVLLCSSYILFSILIGAESTVCNSIIPRV
jgi:hypothetical protein